MIDYEAINETLTPDRIKEILEQLNIPYRDKGSYLIMPTVCHHDSIDDASWKLYFYFNNHLFVCYSEDGNMSIWRFLRLYYETRGIEYNWYTDIYQLIVGETEPVEGLTHEKYRTIRDDYIVNEVPQLPQYNEGVLDCFIKNYPAQWLKEGISMAAMDKYNIRFSISQNKIIIPHYDIDGHLCGIRGRALDPWEVENLGKYMPVQIEGIWYKHPLSLNLYGLYQNKVNIREARVCYLFESEKSVLKCESYAAPNCSAAVCGSQLNKYQLKLLISECAPQEIVICFDREELPGQDEYFNKLWKMCKKYNNYCQMSFIYDRDGLTQMKDSPNDRGEAIFYQLLDKRIIVR